MFACMPSAMFSPLANLDVNRVSLSDMTLLGIPNHVSRICRDPPRIALKTEKLKDLKKLAQQYARDRGSCDDTRISYLEFLESEAEDDLTLARMISG
jgi:hypothetical protein